MTDEQFLAFVMNHPVGGGNRAAAAQAKQAAADAGSTATQFGQRGSQINAALIPGLTQDWQHPSGYTPEQENEMLVAGGQGAAFHWLELWIDGQAVPAARRSSHARKT